MSVRKNDREHGRLECINQMRILIAYTYDRVKDNNIFPKAQRWILAKSIWDAASKAHSNMLGANAIRVENQTDAETRLLMVELAVLDDLDHFIKERLRIRHYVRYMDDMIIIHQSKKFLKDCREQIEAALNSIGLELNRKTTIYPLKQGVKFLQWRFIITETGKILMRMSSSKMGKQRQRLKKLIRREMNGEMPEGTAEASLQAWKANARRGDTYFQQKRMTQFYYTEKARYQNGEYLSETAESGAGRKERGGNRLRKQGRDGLQRSHGDPGRSI